MPGEQHHACTARLGSIAIAWAGFIPAGVIEVLSKSGEREQRVLDREVAVHGWRRCLIPLAALALLGGPAVADEPSSEDPACDEDSQSGLDRPKCPVVHPGDAVWLPGFLCTANFLWQGSDGYRYLGTAGHCAIETAVGGRVEDNASKRIGQLAFKVFDTRRQSDFALIRLDPAMRASADVRHWGGPTKPYRSFTDQPQTLLMHGQASWVSEVETDRELLATAVTSPKIIRFIGPASMNDSGAPVITQEGQAAGWIVMLANGDVPATTRSSGGVEVGENYLVRIDPMVGLAERALGIRLTLRVAPLR
jgi:hypothetical protein